MEADRCVKCGICLPHCPTYKLFRNEGDSPRGRIALMQALAGGELTSQQAEEHIANCLNCLACEKACPSSVKYGELIDLHRQQITQKRENAPSLTTRLITELPYKSVSKPLYWSYQHLGIRPVARLLLGKRFRQIDNLLPRPATPELSHTKPATTHTQARVGLFTGCISRITDRAPLQAAIQTLQVLGVEVITPDLQVCCGALHQHNGHPEQAAHLAEMNQEAFNAEKLDAVIYIASGCGLQLTETSGFDAPVMEICQFINQLKWPNDLHLAPYPEEVILHTPCTLKNGLGLEHEAQTLLKKIPQLALTPLPHDDCCGAAGSMMLNQPAMAGQLRNPIIDTLRQKTPQLLLTSNNGCAMHLRAGVVEAGLDTELKHPVELLRLQLRRDSGTE
ncbi:MAG: (Fe-S)-binding protein [Gammaproteobacteria bacterium]|nr:(Fe-S)-binding protein [Gammaproteobacteria bacterium]